MLNCGILECEVLCYGILHDKILYCGKAESGKIMCGNDMESGIKLKCERNEDNG